MTDKKDEALKLALERIASWNEHPVTLAVDFGSNGVRDFYRNIAREALAEQPAQQCNECESCKRKDTLLEMSLATIEALREQPARQEPVAEVTGRMGDLHIKFLRAGLSLNLGDFLYTSPPASKPLTDDTKRLDALLENSWDLRCFDMPTGAGDADIGWRVIGHHMAKPHERTVAEVYCDDPRQAIDAAIEAAHGIKEQQ